MPFDAMQCSSSSCMWKRNDDFQTIARRADEWEHTRVCLVYVRQKQRRSSETADGDFCIICEWEMRAYFPFARGTGDKQCDAIRCRWHYVHCACVLSVLLIVFLHLLHYSLAPSLSFTISFFVHRYRQRNQCQNTSRERFIVCRTILCHPRTVRKQTMQFGRTGPLFTWFWLKQRPKI